MPIPITRSEEIYIAVICGKQTVCRDLEKQLVFLFNFKLVTASVSNPIVSLNLMQANKIAPWVILCIELTDATLFFKVLGDLVAFFFPGIKDL